MLDEDTDQASVRFVTKNDAEATDAQPIEAGKLVLQGKNVPTRQSQFLQSCLNLSPMLQVKFRNVMGNLIRKNDGLQFGHSFNLHFIADLLHRLNWKTCPNLPCNGGKRVVFGRSRNL